MHCHLLPAVDDGVKTTEESLECLRAAKEAGFTDIVLTRHQMAGVYTVKPEEAAAGRELLQRSIDEAGLGVTVHDGAEHYIDEVFLEKLTDGAESLAHSTAVLVEIPMTRIPPFMADVAFKMRVKGLAPILAHVERYREVVDDPRRAKALAEMGFLLQVNLGSLVGVYGRRIAKTARTIIESGDVFCAGSDVHGPGWIKPCYQEGVAALFEFGDETARRLLRDNPSKIIRGEALS
ncbi:hypothetical protein KDL45_12590 [bacterium]|nr:hypothetical protein [bacterium]MCB9475806.1 hypothetical protein [Deltaproteobacteria bacterium]